jgi:hypothetical protein
MRLRRKSDGFNGALSSESFEKKRIAA